MASDIKLDGEYVSVEGLEVTFDRGTEQSSTALNLKNPTGFWHISGPRTYETGNPLGIYWHNNSNFSGAFFSINTSGNVGIGTNNPANKLHIVGSGPVTIENPNGESDILFKSGNNPSWQVGTNSTGWYVWDNAYRLVVQPGGNIGIGTTNPVRKLHVEGSEIHSGGAASGFSFDDRTQGNAQDGAARLFSQKTGDKFWVQDNGFVQVTGDLDVKGLIRGTVTGLRGLDVGSSPITVYCAADAVVLQRDMGITKPVKYALASELAITNKDSLVINYQGSYKDGVRIEGNVQTTGTLAQASSIECSQIQLQSRSPKRAAYWLYCGRSA
jgi:hypothetical protein